MSDFISMFSPRTGNFADTTRLAFEEIWEARGWLLVDEDPPAQPGQAENTDGRDPKE